MRIVEVKLAESTGLFLGRVKSAEAVVDLPVHCVCVRPDPGEVSGGVTAVVIETCESERCVVAAYVILEVPVMQQRPVSNGDNWRENLRIGGDTLEIGEFPTHAAECEEWSAAWL